MSTSLSIPGVYVRIQEPVPVLPLTLSVTGFVGQATSGPVNYPQVLTNWGQFQDVFGGFNGFSFLAYAVYGFFQNGGLRCYVVRVACESATAATLLPAQAKMLGIGVSAANPGSWGNDVTVSVGSSSGTITLSQVAQTVPASTSGSTTVKLTTIAGIQAGDALTLIDPSNPLSRATFTVQSVDVANTTVTFKGPLGQYLAGTKVVGLGFKLTVQYLPDGVLSSQEVFDNLAMDPGNPQYFIRIVNGLPADPDYVNKAQNGQSTLIQLQDPVATNATAVARPRPAPTSAPLGLENGLDWPLNQPSGLDHRYYTGYDSGKYFSPAGSATSAEYGLALFEGIPEIGLIAIPDLTLPDLYTAVESASIQASSQGIVFTPIPANGVTSIELGPGQSDMLSHCALMQNRFAILDSPRGSQIGIGDSPVDDWVANFRLAPASKNAALYYPWIRERASDFDGSDLLIPPSGHLAGIYANVESLRGIGKAPANQLIQGIVDLEFCLTDDQQSVLNPLSVNCLRALPGRGLMVWGARTLSLDPNWRYVNLRRIYHSIVMNILLNLRWTVFEPNTPKLWAQVRATLTLFLTGLFRQGGLAGNTTADAFFVECDDQTNTPDIIAAGQMLARVGFAPAYPAEFVVVNIKRTADSLAVTEQT
jgi:uncharacterized protein